MPPLVELNEFPAPLLKAEPRDLLKILGGPTLVYLKGRRDPPLFISVLQHGNEGTGFVAFRELMRRYQGRELPRSVFLFIGNVAAAALGMRSLRGGDFNRFWGGVDHGPGPLLERVRQRVLGHGLFASIDVHNNTGRNPHYACISRLDARSRQLASLFSRTTVYFLEPKRAQSVVFSKDVTALTIECGQSGNPAGTKHALEFLDACLHIAELPDRLPGAGAQEIYHTIARVELGSDCRIAFSTDPVEKRNAASVVFRGDLDQLNFTEAGKGTVLAEVMDSSGFQWSVRHTSTEVSPRPEPLLVVEDRKLILNTELIPSMFTLDASVMRDDCLGYLMVRWQD